MRRRKNNVFRIYTDSADEKQERYCTYCKKKFLNKKLVFIHENPSCIDCKKRLKAGVGPDMTYRDGDSEIWELIDLIG